MRESRGLIVIDEVQRLPELFATLRPLCDDPNRQAQFLLLGLQSSSELAMHPRYGASWEGFALEQTRIAHGSRDSYFYRTQRGAELDLLLLRRGRRWGFEFKCTDAPKTSRSMHIVKKDLQLDRLWVLYPGEQEYPLAESITALPLRGVGQLVLEAG